MRGKRNKRERNRGINMVREMGAGKNAEEKRKI